LSTSLPLFLFHAPPPPQTYPLSLHDALPILAAPPPSQSAPPYGPPIYRLRPAGLVAPVLSNPSTRHASTASRQSSGSPQSAGQHHAASDPILYPPPRARADPSNKISP